MKHWSYFYCFQVLLCIAFCCSCATQSGLSPPPTIEEVNGFKRWKEEGQLTK